MRVVFMGTPEFAVPVLSALLQHHDVRAVYTRPDAGSGRGRRVKPTPVKSLALDAGVPVEQPRTLRDPETTAALADVSPDVIVVAAYGAILPQEVLDIPALGCVNVHASLLPRWRGAAPIQRAILAGDAETGVSIMRMEAGLDTGDYCLQVATRVDAKTSADLTAELALLGAGALIDALAAIEAGNAVWTAQDEAAVTYASKLSAADVALDPSLTVDEALRRVRASGPSAPCRMLLADRRLTVIAASESSARPPAGSATCVRELVIGLVDGGVRLDSVVPEGRSAMAGDAFARGARLGGGCTWSAS